MSVSRRIVLQGLAGAALAGPLGATPAPRAAGGDAGDLRAAPGTAQLAPAEYPPTPVWGYDTGTGAGVPGPTLRVPQGGRLTRRFVNDLPEASTIHWHGVRIANAMDGVPGLTQDAVPPGGAFLYDFVLPDAGTYWYHPHNRTWEQLARGLYGALIVEEARPPQVDRDEVLLIDDWRLADDATLAGGFGALHDWAHAGRIGNWITVNGDPAWTRPAARHDRLRLRLVNTANARVLALDLQGLEGWIVALDGQPLARPLPYQSQTLAPAQRADLIVDVTAVDGGEAFVISRERDGDFAVAAFAVAGTRRAAPMPPPEPLPANPVPRLGDPGSARAVTLRMEGGAMGRMTGAAMGGRMMGVRDLASAGKVWALNGMADMPAEPLIAARLGETVRLRLVNDTAWPHAMHLHGHHFRPLDADGQAGALRDTVLVERGETRDVAFVADNPGDWLVHCHMVEHSAGGMMTWLRVG